MKRYRNTRLNTDAVEEISYTELEGEDEISFSEDAGAEEAVAVAEGEE